MAKPNRAAKQMKRPTRKPAPKPTRPRTAAAPTPAEALEPVSTLPAVRPATPQRGVAARGKPPPPPPPPPPGGRGTFRGGEEPGRPGPASRAPHHPAIERADA